MRKLLPIVDHACLSADETAHRIQKYDHELSLSLVRSTLEERQMQDKARHRLSWRFREIWEVHIETKVLDRPQLVCEAYSNKRYEVLSDKREHMREWERNWE